MDKKNSEKILDRIIQGYYFQEIQWEGEDVEVKFVDADRELNYWASYQADKKFKDAQGFTIEESYEILRIRGLWSDEEEKLLSSTEKDLSYLKSQLATVEFNQAREKYLKHNIEIREKETSNLLSRKNQLLPSTIEHQKNAFKQKIIIKKTLETANSKLLDSDKFLNSLLLYYNNKDYPTLKDIRRLARTEPWRLIWATSKDTSTALLDKSASNMTDLQEALISWTRIYDWTFSHPDRPADEVIEDDDKLDAWIESQTQKSKRDGDEKRIGNSKQGDKFIPCDEKSAQKIWAMNDPQARIKARQRQSVIDSKGEISESQLPDVKNELIMEMNRRQFEKK